MPDLIQIDHGGGGRRTRDLIRDLFKARFSNPALESEGDAAVVDTGGSTLALTTDGHVVQPLEFPGGDIGRLSVCGTVNDLAVTGAVPRYLTASFIIEEGFSIDRLSRIVDSMADAAGESGVSVVAGDTKVVERGSCDGLFISTAGVGHVGSGREGIATARDVVPGDVILVNGPVGDHGAAIACARNEIITEPPLVSDCAPLAGIISRLFAGGLSPVFMRDATRGGLATVLCELAEMRGIDIEVDEARIPVRDTVRGVCEMYGFDPLYLANEGTFITVCHRNEADAIRETMAGNPRGRDARVIGRVGEFVQNRPARAVLKTAIGGSRLLRLLSGEQLPRIC